MKLVIFGCGKIANRIAESCKLVKGLDLVGFASKDINKAKQYSLKYECNLYGDYDYFLNSDVDAVYIATYNQSHYELIKKCLEHHKAVICEKPMLSNVEQLEELFTLAKENNVLLMEALKSVFLPLMIKVKQMIKDKVIGDIKQIETGFNRCGNHLENHWINDPITGGALKDLGSYCVGTMNFIMEKIPTLIKYESDRKVDKADTTALVELKYGNVLASASVSNTKDGLISLIVSGDKGKIVVDNFWKTGEGYYEIDGIKYELHEELVSDFYYELKHFMDLYNSGEIISPIMNKDASKNILLITDRS